MSTKGKATVDVIKRDIPTFIRWQVWICGEDGWEKNHSVEEEKVALRLATDYEYNHVEPVCVIRIEIPAVVIGEKK